MPDPKAIDKRNTSEPGEYAISFASRMVADDYEHAFIVWFESNPQGFLTTRKAVGFYPTSANKAYDLLLAAGDGKIYDDSMEKIEWQLAVQVNRNVFEKARQVEGKYKDGQKYQLAFNDCVTFVEQVANTVPGLVVPSRITNIFPSSFIKAMYESN